MPFVTVGRLTQLCAGCDVVCASLGHHHLSRCRDAFSPAVCDDVGPLGSVTWRLLVIRRCWGAVRTRSNVYACCSGMWGAGGSRVAWFGGLTCLCTPVWCECGSKQSACGELSLYLCRCLCFMTHM